MVLVGEGIEREIAVEVNRPRRLREGGIQHHKAAPEAPAWAIRA